MPAIATAGRKSTSWRDDAIALSSRCHVTKILIVDDLEGVRRMLIYALEDDYNVLQASNGLEAIQLAHSIHPDVIVMDLDMPVMDGAEATRQIKSNPSLADIKVLAVTGQNDSEKSRLIKDDCDAFIEKPFQVDELVEAVKRLSLK
jgi:CheY-like chemotaxis protein